MDRLDSRPPVGVDGARLISDSLITRSIGSSAAFEALPAVERASLMD